MVGGGTDHLKNLHNSHSRRKNSQGSSHSRRKNSQGRSGALTGLPPVSAPQGGSQDFL